MPSKLFSRLRSPGHRDSQGTSAPAYSASPSVGETPSPPYEERGGRPATLTRTISDSSYTLAEISSWNDAADEAQRSQDEELPPYEEKRFYPNLTMLNWSMIPVAPPRSQPHNMCPCAQCHNLR